MASIAELYNLNHSPSQGGVQGYHVQKKYLDPIKLKQQRVLSKSKDKPQGVKPVNVSKKTTFIDQVQKISAKLPGPTSYETLTKEKSNSKIVNPIVYPDRQTVFDEIEKKQKKRHIPGAGTYGKIQTQTDKTKLRPNLSLAEQPTYLQASMRKSLESPGVGNYNAYRAVFDKRGTKWVEDKSPKEKKENKIKFPSVGAYNPNPISYRLFSGITSVDKKKSRVDLTQRFKTKKQKKVPFYNIMSEWGMKNSMKKKDILSKVSAPPSSSRSVYY